MPRVAVLGRGLLGSATAYHLCRLGLKVVSIDGGTAASSGTARSAGLILHRGTEAEVKLVAQTVADISELEADLGETIKLHRSGTIRVITTETEFDQVANEAALVNASTSGGRVKWLPLRDVLRLAPYMRLDEEGFNSALFPGDCYADPSMIAEAYCRAAKLQFSGCFETITEDASALLPTPDRRGVRGVRLASGKKLVCDHVVSSSLSPFPGRMLMHEILPRPKEKGLAQLVRTVVSLSLYIPLCAASKGRCDWSVGGFTSI